MKQPETWDGSVPDLALMLLPSISALLICSLDPQSSCRAPCVRSLLGAQSLHLVSVSLVIHIWGILATKPQHSERTVSPFLALTVAIEKSHVTWHCYSCASALALLPDCINPLSLVFCGFDEGLLLTILSGTMRIPGADGRHLSLMLKNSVAPLVTPIF